MAALAGIVQGYRVACLMPDIEPEAQSMHWHGYLHRGHLYDPRRESDLIALLKKNAPFWSSTHLATFIEPMPCHSTGRDGLSRDRDRRRIRSDVPSGLRSSLRVATELTDESVIDGPRFLAAARQAVRRGATVWKGRATRISAAGEEILEIERSNQSSIRVRCPSVVVAAGSGTAHLLPHAGVTERRSRMLVLKGDLPQGALITPGPAHGGLFVVSRECAQSLSPERAWLVSDNYSETAPDSQPLIDGWWICSVMARLEQVSVPGLIDGCQVGAYSAAKTGLNRPGRAVSSSSFSVEGGTGRVAFVPSKWSSTPYSACALVSAVKGATMRGPAETLRLMAQRIESADEATSRLTEQWQTVQQFTAASGLLRPGLDAVRTAARLLSPMSAAFLETEMRPH